MFSCIKWHLWFFNVLILHEGMPASAMPNSSINEMNKITEITSNTLFFLMCGHIYFAEHKETLSGFHSLKLAILSRTRWVEISSSLISRSAFEENQGKSHSSFQKQAISDSWGPTEVIREHTFLLESVWLKLQSWSKKPNKHACNLRNISVPCRKACQSFHP